MISPEKGLPSSFNPDTGQNIKWSAELGSQTHSTPVVAGGRVLIGTNNDHPRDPKHQGDRGVLLCLDGRDGHLLWQLVCPKLEDDQYLDWPKAGMCSSPTVEGDRAYTLTNRGELVCLDMKGLADGNQGPYQDEARHMTPRGAEAITSGTTDADILWLTDLVSHPQIGIHPHDQIFGSVLLDGDLLYVNSCNGVDNTHRVIRRPDAPSLVVFDKHTGRLVAKDDLRLGPNIFHATWCPPSLGEVNGRKVIFFGGGDGVLYAFEALQDIPPPGQVATLKPLWHFDPDPTAPKQDVHKYLHNFRESPSVIMGMPVFVDGRIYFTAGGDVWWGKRQGWLKCVDAGKPDATGPLSETWSYALTKNTCCTPAVADGLVLVADLAGVIHCVDAATGHPYWTHQTAGPFWASPLVADGKVFIGNRRGEFLVLQASNEKRLLSTIDLQSPISATAVAANGVLYVTTMSHLYAIHQPPHP